MNWIDTHAHLFLTEFDADRDAVLARASQAGVQYVLLPNIDTQSLEPLYACEQAYPQICKSMMGLHPCSVSANVNQQLRTIEQQLDQHYFVGVGEIGLDFYWDTTYREQQLKAFRTQLQWAGELHLPVSIHSRSAIDACIQEVKALQRGQLQGVFHCFTGNVSQALQIIDLGFLLGIGGVVTFKNSTLPRVIQQIPPEYIVLETDAPYLSPVPHRGKRNESSYIPLIGQALANIWQKDMEEIAQITTANAFRVFTALNH
ncbi:MAG: TatD family hydrolase [Thermoflavifilum sp.]|nr:TatD family hydrolase [Thermoflavifilum sp.]